jgi:hypothetical protein
MESTETDFVRIAPEDVLVGQFKLGNVSNVKWSPIVSKPNLFFATRNVTDSQTVDSLELFEIPDMNDATLSCSKKNSITRKTKQTTNSHSHRSI